MNRIKELRKINKMTQEDLAQKLNVKRSAISKYENNTVPLTDTLIINLTDIFKVSSDYLLGITEFPISSLNINSNSITNKKKKHLINNYDKLNDNGKNKLLDYSEDLIASNKYNDLILSTVAARSKDNNEPIKQEYIRDLSKIPPDDTDL